MPIPIRVEPTCRYGHGLLTRIADKQIQHWALAGVNAQLGHGFMVTLHVCLRCGYAEIFDTDPVKSKADLEAGS